MEVQGLVLSFTLILGVVAVGVLLSLSKLFSTEFSRKFIHIGVSNWWFILITYFDSLPYALIGPLFFIVVNTIVVYTNLATTLGISEERRNMGLIYYPITLTLLVILGFKGVFPLWACGIGMIVMGYGDGLAAVIGGKWGKRKIWGRKTQLGTIVMAVVTFIILILFSVCYNLRGLWSFPWWFSIILIALTVALTETYTPYGLDNISVPLVATLLSYLFLGGR
ncbi:MAG: diacylglycerol/polyprenol kinase family protein [Sphaerochaetaceae bacterium]|jgi:phytol kinase|nr:hypothetical protein [Sphaerochaetaceae bacterium]HHU88546.1 hypothetical protein [Spirochaetales bacterium]